MVLSGTNSVILVFFTVWNFILWMAWLDSCYWIGFYVSEMYSWIFLPDFLISYYYTPCLYSLVYLLDTSTVCDVASSEFLVFICPSIGVLLMIYLYTSSIVTWYGVMCTEILCNGAVAFSRLRCAIEPFITGDHGWLATCATCAITCRVGDVDLRKHV